jgi:hypothetical protein
VSYLRSDNASEKLPYINQSTINNILLKITSSGTLASSSFHVLFPFLLSGKLIALLSAKLSLCFSAANTIYDIMCFPEFQRRPRVQ